uniref:PB1 domain-containing protein n=1 Tax=Arundo donax TaxID=35708 RepID=A0A0A9E8T2_ARUDO
MCSFGGRILPRPGDRQLRYVGGETRIVAVPRAAASYAALVAALSKVAPALFAPGAPLPVLKYQLPQDDLDSLISVTSDDDVDHLMDEFDRLHDLAASVARLPRLRLFLFAPEPHAGAFGSVLSGTGGEAASDQWFVDALNAPAPHPIERGRSEASSIISEVPDYLFGLDTASDEPSPGPAAAARSKSDTETPHHGEDDSPAPAPGAHQAPYAAEGSSWPAPPPPYMAQPVYYFPVPPPVHYLDPAAQGGYMPRPVYHIVGGGGSEVLGGDPHAPGGNVYGVPHPMQPYPQMMYAPPPRGVVYTSEGRPAAEGGGHSS